MLKTFRLLCLVCFSLLSACVSIVPSQNNAINPELDKKYSSLSPVISRTDNEDLTLILTFSGGGTRAAAFSYGVLKALHDTPVEFKGQARSLLSEVDIISSVSGGSFTAAYYGLFGDKIFDDFESTFLKQAIQTKLTDYILFSPRNWLKMFSTLYDRSDLAADYYDKKIFKNKQFKNMRRDAPLIVINATDLSTGAAFSFTKDDFRWICSDLRNFSVGKAVAASSAVPILFSSIGLKNHPGCEPYAYQTQFSDQEGAPKNEQALGLRKYQQKQRYPYLHLVDGGVADNLGLRSILHVISEQDNSFWQTMKTYGLSKTKKVVFIVVNAADTITPEIAMNPFDPSLENTLAAVTTIQSQRYNRDTLHLLENQFHTWRNQVKAGRCLETKILNCSEIEFHMLELNFNQLPTEQAQALSLLATSLELETHNVDDLIKAGQDLLQQSSQFQRLFK